MSYEENRRQIDRGLYFNPDPSPESMWLGGFFGYVFWIICIISGFGTPIGNGAILYLVLGVITLVVKTASVVKYCKKTSLAQEIVFGFRNWEVFAELLIWPLILLLFLFRDPELNSFKFQYHNHYWQELMSERPGIHVETANEWTDRATARISKRADEQGEMVSEAVKPIARAAAVGTVAVAVTASSAHPQAPIVQAIAFADQKGDRQSSFTASQGRFTLLEQNRVTADGKSNTSLLGLGIKLPPWRGVNATLVIGPQFNWKDETKPPIIKGIWNLSLKRGKFSVLSSNWIAYGIEQKKITASRHIQTFAIPGLPAWLLPNFEQLHVRGAGFTELYTGLNIKFGQWRGKDSFFSKASLTPYYNWAPGKERWDARLQLAF